MIERFIDDLRVVDKAVQEGDGERLLEIFTCAKQARDRFTGN